jgi:hypothetical protein
MTGEPEIDGGLLLLMDSSCPFLVFCAGGRADIRAGPGIAAPVLSFVEV